MMALRKPDWRLTASILVGLALLVLSFPTGAAAQDGTPQDASSCRTCHEDLYYNHDRGHWYCLCEGRPSCSNCHGGDATQYNNQDAAHAGLVINPIREDPERCKACHPDLADERLAIFASTSGIDYTIPPDAPCAQPAAPGSTKGGQPLASQLAVAPMEPWRVAGLSLVAILFPILLVFGYRCWKTDCDKTRLFSEPR